jgi:hypothetical protein
LALQLWLPLNGNIHNQGLCDVKISGHPNSWENGKIGKCGLFNNNNYLFMNNYSQDLFQPSHDKSISIACWVKCTGIRDTTNSYIIAWNSYEFSYSFNRIMFKLGNGSENTYGVYGTIDGNGWHHVAGIWDAKNKKVQIYFDGELFKDITVSQSINFNSISSSITLPYKNIKNNLSINDFRLYDECLSPKQIKYISQAMICHYPMGNIDGKIGGRNLLRNSSMIGERLKCDRSQSCNSTTTLAYSNDGFHIVTPSEGNDNNGIVFIYDDFTRLGINIGDTITFSLLVKGSSDSNKPFINIIFQNDGTTWYDKGTIRSLGIEFTPTDVFQKIYVTYTLPTDKKYSSKTMFLGIHGNMKSDLYIKNLKLEKSSTSTPYTPAPEDNPPFYDNIIPDISGYQNNGEVTDSACPTWSNDSPRYLGSYEFNGKNQYISGLSPISNNTKEFTIAFWVKLNNTSGAMTFYTARIGMGSGVALFFANKNIRFDDNVKSTFNYTYDLSSNKWTHLCVTRNNTSKKLYVNGKLVDSTSNVGNMQNIGKYFTIGGSESSDNGIADMNWLNGNISDFRIYSTVLSDEDVLDLYQSSASLDSQGNLMLTGEVIE